MIRLLLDSTSPTHYLPAWRIYFGLCSSAARIRTALCVTGSIHSFIERLELRSAVPEIILATMPYGSLANPSVALGVLTAGAKAAGLDTATVQGQFRFAERIGLPRYAVIGGLAGRPELFGEWTFAPAAFPDFQDDEEEYIRRFVRENPFFPKIQAFGPDESILGGILRRARALAPDFINELAEEILDAQPRIVGCSSSLEQHCASLALLRKIKELDPAVTTMLGGPNCEGRMGPANIQAFPWLDIVVSGEADEFFPRLCKDILDTGPHLDPASFPKSVYCAHWEPNAERNDAVSSRVEEMDRLPVPDYDDYFNALDGFSRKHKVYSSISVESSRGCWWGKCIFCSFNGDRGFFRAKSPDRVIREIRGLHERYGLARFHMAENNIAPAYLKSFLVELADDPELDLLLEWGVSANLTEDQVELLAGAGVRSVFPGIEGLQEDHVNALKKPADAVQNVAFLKNTRQNGIRVNWFFLYGFPGDRDAWYHETAATMELLFHLAPPRMLLPVRIERHSRYHRFPDEYGLDLTPEPAYAMIYPLPPEQLNDLAFYFEDKNRLGKKNIESNGMEKVRAVVARWRKAFAAEPGPQLIAREIHDRVIITDTRPCAPQAEVELTGLAAKVFTACRRPTTRPLLIDSMNPAGSHPIPPEDIEATLHDLINAKLLLELGGKVLSLALFEPVRPLINDSDIQTRAQCRYD